MHFYNAFLSNWSPQRSIQRTARHRRTTPISCRAASAPVFLSPLSAKAAALTLCLLMDAHVQMDSTRMRQDCVYLWKNVHVSTTDRKYIPASLSPIGMNTGKWMIVLLLLPFTIYTFNWQFDLISLSSVCINGKFHCRSWKPQILGMENSTAC